jgi:hypothetical protein
MTFPLGTSAAIAKNAPLLLVDLETEEGITGHSYVFCYRSSLESLAEISHGIVCSPVTSDIVVREEL